MATKTPLRLVQEKFGGKAKLVEAIENLTGEALWVSRTNKEKGLAHVSNAKLLRLHATFTEVKNKFGTREKLIDAVLELQNRTKDAGLRQKLSAWPVPRLFDAYKSAAKRNARVKPAAPAASAPRAVPAKSPNPARPASPKTAKTPKDKKKDAKK